MAYAGLTLVTPPLAEPVTVADAKAHSRVFIDLDDSLIAGYLTSARMTCENHARRAFLTQQWQLSLQAFPGRRYLGYREASSFREYLTWSYIELPLPPLVSVDSFVYYDTLNNEYVMQQGYTNIVGNYFVDLSHEPGRACLPFSGVWPTTVLLPQAPIQIVYTCGWPLTVGMCTVDPTGVLTLVSSPIGAFDPRLVGSWITIGTGSSAASYDILYVISPTQLQLTRAQGNPNATLPISTPTFFTSNVVPMPIKHAILFLAGHFYETREPIDVGRGLVAIEIPGTVDTLLGHYRIFQGVDETND